MSYWCQRGHNGQTAWIAKRKATVIQITTGWYWPVYNFILDNYRSTKMTWKNRSWKQCLNEEARTFRFNKHNVQQTPILCKCWAKEVAAKSNTCNLLHHLSQLHSRWYKFVVTTTGYKQSVQTSISESTTLNIYWVWVRRLKYNFFSSHLNNWNMNNNTRGPKKPESHSNEHHTLSAHLHEWAY